PLIAKPRRTVAGAPIDGVGRGIIVSRHPCGRAAGLPGVGLLPGLAARLAWRRHRVSLPYGLSGLGVERLDKPTHAELAAGNAHEHLALHDQRRRGRIVPLLPVLEL